MQRMSHPSQPWNHLNRQRRWLRSTPCCKRRKRVLETMMRIQARLEEATCAQQQAQPIPVYGTPRTQPPNVTHIVTPPPHMPRTDITLESVRTPAAIFYRSSNNAPPLRLPLLAQRNTLVVRTHELGHFGITATFNRLLSDQGNESLNKLVERVANSFGILRRVTSPFHPTPMVKRSAPSTR